MPDRTITSLANDYHLNLEQVRELFRLLEQKYSAPYILRYRQDLAANLNTDDIAVFRRFLQERDELEKERAKIQEKLKEQGVENEELSESIETAETLSELFDHYVPYRPRKRSRSRLAISRGLAPLALQIIEHELDHADLAAGAREYTNPDMELHTISDVLTGVYYIISDWIAEEKSHRDAQRTVINNKGRLIAKRIGKWDKRMHDEFREYSQFAEKLSDVHHAQVLSLMRGKRLNALRFRVETPLEDMYLQAAELYLEGGEREFYEIDASFHDQKALPAEDKLTELTGPQLLYWCIRESISRTLAPILSKEKERDLRKNAQEHALGIVRRNLRSKLLTPPVGNGRIMGIDPGFRTGCKLVALDDNGTVLDSKIVYPHTPKNKWDEAKETIAAMIGEHQLSVASLGDNNGSRETENLLAEIIEENCNEFRYLIQECGPAEIYAKSNLAARELGDVVPEKMRTALALGLQALRPIEELTKVDLTNICALPYLKEINKADLEKELYSVAEECVGEVGPDINTAPVSLLRYVPGLTYKAAREITEWREDNPPFKTRRDLRQVPALDIEMWYKSAPFVRVGDPESPLDITRIHPDHYRMAQAILEQLQLTVDDLKDPEQRDVIRTKKKEVDLTGLEEQFDMHYLYGKFMLDELAQPWPDPRREMSPPPLRQAPLSLDRIKPLQMLEGEVQKVVDFGAFVDIGAGEDGLVHISELSEKFVESPYDIVFPGETVTVWVMDIDPENKRIALSMRSEESARRASQKRAKIKEQKETRKRIDQKKKEAQTRVPTAQLHSSMQQSKAAAGRQSQRMKKIKEFRGHEEKTAPPETAKQQSVKKEKETDEKRRSDEDNVQGDDLLKRLQFAAIEKRGEDK